MLPAMFLPTSTTLFASDLSIYQGGTEGKTNIVLMLDTSGSMGISSLVMPKDNKYGSPGDVEETVCARDNVYETDKSQGTTGNLKGNILEYQYNAVDRRNHSPTKGRTSFYKEVVIGGTKVPYYVRGCGTATVDATGKLIESGDNKFDRLSRLKDAILTLLADGGALDIDDPNKYGDIKIGLGHFSTQTSLKVGSSSSNILLVDGHSGNILFPASPLSPENRLALAREITKFQSIDTTTKQDGSPADKDSTGYSSQRYSSTNPPNIFKASSGTPTVHAYAEVGAYMMGTQTRATPRLTKGFVQYVYDGASTIRRRNNDGRDLDDQAYFICVALGTTLTNAYGLTNNVKQCVNKWPSRSGNKLNNGTINDVWIPYQGNWLRLGTSYTNWDERNAVNAAKDRLNAINFTNDWDLYEKFPSGWRYGGWMKVDHEPMDIEPITAAPWDQNTIFRNLVSYRTNPFALEEIGNPLTSYTDNMAGGFSYSATNTKNGDKYIPGGSANSCDGNGIYFLTDGAPNSTKPSMAQAILNDSLTSGSLPAVATAGTYGFSRMPTGDEVLKSPKMQSNLFEGETGGWEYIGEYAKKLRNKRENGASAHLNPGQMEIKTAVVGFGSSFEGLAYHIETYTDQNGNAQTRKVYDCDTATASQDARNACKWGSAEYGDGGFYQANSVEDIQQSIIDFVNNTKPKFTPSSLGSISVPRDPLDQTRLMTQGFFPMVMPVEDTTVRTWAGNLKKYNIVGGTLKDASNNPIYTISENQQVINSAAKDLWSIEAASGIDHAMITSGGAWNKIPVPSMLDITNQPSSQTSERNVFVLDGTSLKKVTKENLATDYSGSTPSMLDLNNINITKRYALLNYLGYNASLPPTATTLTTVELSNLTGTPNNPYRYLGGVVHSTPLVVTKSATLSSSGNSVGRRNEYVVYGSMEGGLHIVDASNGVEQSVFVPTEVLNNQADTLASALPKKSPTYSSFVYGVDAPWTADNTFAVKTTTVSNVATTAYEANRMNIYGGLRMGGEAMYGLDILNPKSPKKLFHITPTTNGFERMAQIWSKPTIANIRVKGQRKRVLIFGGGYDANVYEHENTASTRPTTATRGNALYIVDAATGDLIWSTSSNATTTTKTTEAEHVKYSVVGQPVVRDYDADGLADMIYFADLGGQIFRVDLNNVTQVSPTVDRNIAVRVARIADLNETDFTPRFYDRLTTAVFNNGQSNFVLVTVGSGNRSFPLESSAQHNKIYGIFDYDAARNGLEDTTFNDFSDEATISNIANRGALGKDNTNVAWGEGGSLSSDIFKVSLQANTLRGWSYNLISVDDTASQRYSKSFEESQLISNDLYVNVYDPKASLMGQTSQCGGGVQGLSTTHRICAPYGDCAAYVMQDYQGIIGPTLGAVSDSANRTSKLVGPITANKEKCFGNCSPTAGPVEVDLKEYSQSRSIRATRWFEW